MALPYSGLTRTRRQRSQLSALTNPARDMAPEVRMCTATFTAHMSSQLDSQACFRCVCIHFCFFHGSRSHDLFCRTRRSCVGRLRKDERSLFVREFRFGLGLGGSSSRGPDQTSWSADSLQPLYTAPSRAEMAWSARRELGKKSRAWRATVAWVPTVPFCTVANECATGAARCANGSRSKRDELVIVGV